MDLIWYILTARENRPAPLVFLLYRLHEQKPTTCDHASLCFGLVWFVDDVFRQTRAIPWVTYLSLKAGRKYRWVMRRSSRARTRGHSVVRRRSRFRSRRPGCGLRLQICKRNGDILCELTLAKLAKLAKWMRTPGANEIRSSNLTVPSALHYPYCSFCSIY